MTALLPGVLALVIVPMRMLSGDAFGALPDEECAIADVAVETTRRDANEWHHVGRGRLHIQDDGRVRRYSIQVFRQDFRFWMMRLPDGSTLGYAPPSLIAALAPRYAGRTSSAVRVGVNGEIHEWTGDLELRVLRQACLQRVE